MRCIIKELQLCAENLWNMKSNMKCFAPVVRNNDILSSLNLLHIFRYYFNIYPPLLARHITNCLHICTCQWSNVKVDVTVLDKAPPWIGKGYSKDTSSTSPTHMHCLPNSNEGGNGLFCVLLFAHFVLCLVTRHHTVHITGALADRGLLSGKDEEMWYQRFARQLSAHTYG